MCENTEKCPVYTGILKQNPMMIKIYKNLYCQSEDGKHKCKRYMLKNAIGRCPDNILPNDSRNLQDIINIVQGS